MDRILNIKSILLVAGVALTVYAGFLNIGMMAGAWTVGLKNFITSVLVYAFWLIYIGLKIWKSESPKKTCGTVTIFALVVTIFAMLGNNPVTLLVLCPIAGVMGFASAGYAGLGADLALIAAAILLWWICAMYKAK